MPDQEVTQKALAEQPAADGAESLSPHPPVKPAIASQEALGSGLASTSEELGAGSEGAVFGGRAPEAVQAHIERITGSWKGAPPIKAHRAPAELPQTLQAEAKRQGVPLKEIVAAWHNGEIHLIGSHPDLTTERAVEEAIYHEAHGHFGMRQVMGRDLRPYSR